MILSDIDVQKEREEKEAAELARQLKLKKAAEEQVSAMGLKEKFSSLSAAEGSVVASVFAAARAKKDPEFTLANLDLDGPDGNAFTVMGYAKSAMKSAKFSKVEIDTVIADAMSGKYEHLVAVCEAACQEANRRIAA